LTQDDFRSEVSHGGERNAILARLKPRLHANFKPVAQIAWQLIDAGFAWEVEEVHGTTGWVIAETTGNLALVNGRSDLGMSFVMEFQDIFTNVWCRLLCEAELEATTQAPTQANTSHGDARPGSKDEAKSPTERHRHEVILEAAKIGRRGMEYCKFLDDEGIRPSPRLKGCPSTYTAAYKSQKWRKSIQQEKTRIVGQSSKDAQRKSNKTVTIQ